MKTDSEDYVLCVNDANVRIQEKSILKDISLTASSGKILAILGPTGSGKTTLLNAISGRVPLTSGSVTVNQKRFNKQHRRRIGFVLQSDVFLSNLTLWETLYFTAMIRIPENVPKKDKLARLNQIVDELDIRGCLQTVVGDMFRHGLSGGEKKRANIACELITDPDILLMDEPTSGLDSSTAYSLMKQIKHLAVNCNKMVILTLHQPSSQIFKTIESLLLITHGQAAYFGNAHEEPEEFLRQFGLVCEPHFNPADFYLDVLKSDENKLKEIITAQRQSAIGICESNGFENIQGGHIKKCPSSDSMITTKGSKDAIVSFDTIASVSKSLAAKNRKRWPTGFFTQFRMLTWRNYKQAKGRVLHPYDVMKYIFLAAVVGALFYQIRQNEDSVRDRQGMDTLQGGRTMICNNNYLADILKLYFCITFWVFDSSTMTVFAVPAERGVIAKERMTGAYRLSAYYLAKSASELPLHIICPIPFYSFAFWMAGLGGVSEYFATLAVLLLTTVTSQGVGLFLGCAIMDVRLASTLTVMFVLFGILLSGFVTQMVPVWLDWAKYLSIINYALSAMSISLFQNMDNIPCNATSVSTFPKCFRNGTDHVTSQDILHNAGIDLPIYCYISTLFIISIVFRVAAYLVLRYRQLVPR